MVSIRATLQGRHGARLIDTPPRMISLTTDSPQRNATVITIAWPSVSDSVLRVRLWVIVFCILALPRVTLGITAEEVMSQQITKTRDRLRLPTVSRILPLPHCTEFIGRVRKTEIDLCGQYTVV